ncbi:MAG: septation protein SpoVG family protein [Oscillospiraceae bacterium]
MLCFYDVDKKYIEFLKGKEIEKRGISFIPNMEYGDREQKFLCGIVLKINSLNYYVPVSSYKKQQSENILIQIKDKKANPIKGSLRFNYMFPVPDYAIKKRDFSLETRIYRKTFLENQLAFCNSIQDDIRSKALSTYNKIVTGKDKFLTNFSGDFLLYETACLEHQIAHLPAKQQEFFMPKNNRNEGNIMELTLEKAQEIMSKNNGHLNISFTKITELPEGLTVGGYLDLRGTGVTQLPEGLKVGGYLDLRGTGVTQLPEGLEVGGDLDLRGTGVTQLPEGLKIGGDLELRGTSITTLPADLTVGGWLDLEETKITQLSEGLKVGGDLIASRTKITELPEGLEVKGNLDISFTNIKKLPDGLKVNGNLDISYTNITKLPDGLKVNGNLDIHCTNITKLPDGLKVNGNLDIHSTLITKLPEGLEVNGNLDISYTAITELPENLKVGGDFKLNDSKITKLPEGLEVKGNLNINFTKITDLSMKDLPEKLFVGGEIFALPPTIPQTREEWKKWGKGIEKWETEIAKRQKQQLPHSEEKQAAENEKPKPIELLIRTIPFEKDGSNVKGFAMVIINNSFCVKNIKILEGKNGLSVQMPSFKDVDGTLKDMAFAKTKEARDEMEFQILKEFEKPSEKKIDKELISIKNDIKVSMELMSGDKAVKGIATITINEIYVIKRASIVEGKNGLFVQMPSYKKADGEYENIVFPIEKNAREQLNSALLDKYNEAFKNQNEKTMQDYQAEIEAEKIEKAMEQQVGKQIIEEKSR